MTTGHADLCDTGVLASLLSDEVFHPAEPQTLNETGLSPVMIESLVGKYLLQSGAMSGRRIAARLCLPFGVLETVLTALRARQVLVHRGTAQLNDYVYALTDEGTVQARAAMQACSYVGPAPVPLEDYVTSVEAQTIRAEAAQRQQLEEAFCGISVEPELMDLLGPAVNSGAGLFLYGAPGNGKTTLARRITRCFHEHVWIPRTLTDDGQFIKLYDVGCHRLVEKTGDGILKATNVDQRWIHIHRPTVVVGGELTSDDLEVRHNPHTNVSEASIQLKSNCGCLLIDDFGRQRIDPAALLNRWTVPLESRHDILTLATGKKIEVPFEQLIIFSTNIDPLELADEAFLRRVPYKIETRDPSVAEFSRILETACQAFGCRYHPEAVQYLVDTQYAPQNRPLRRCHARDILLQLKNYCTYHNRPLELRPDYLDRVCKSYFTAVGRHVSKPAGEGRLAPPPPTPAGAAP